MGEEISIMDELESALIENSRLRSLLSDAMKELERDADPDGHHFSESAADVYARIKATQTGGE